MHKNPMPFSIISYNILADSYIEPSFYPTIPAYVLAPERRLSLLLRRIREYAADAMCFQEVEPHTFHRIKAELDPFGYAAYFAQKQAKPDGCATFIKQAATAIRAQPLYYHDGPEPGTDSGYVALLLIVQGASSRIGIANTHFKWDSPDTRSEEQWGYRQALQLIDHLSSTYSADTPWVVCGDFNAVPSSELVGLFKDAGFVDAYRDREQVFTCASNRKAKRVDYVLHASSLTSRPMDLLAITDDTPLPSDGEPSDHIAIGAWLDRWGG